jgi:hypothetical protein
MYNVKVDIIKVICWIHIVIHLDKSRLDIFLVISMALGIGRCGMSLLIPYDYLRINNANMGFSSMYWLDVTTNDCNVVG